MQVLNRLWVEQLPLMVTGHQSLMIISLWSSSVCCQMCNDMSRGQYGGQTNLPNLSFFVPSLVFTGAILL